MSEYLTTYGVKDARRERFLKWTIGGALALAICGAILYSFFIKDFKLERQTGQFIQLLEKKDYQAAYRLWGCTPETPCADYTFEKFMEDWGPTSSHADVSKAKIVKTRSCDGGIIRVMEFPPDERVLLFVDRTTLAIGFAPWEFCNPRWQPPATGAQK
jgi:hypothetical protein